MNILEQKELEILASGEWGTIGKRSKSAAAALAAYMGAKYGLLCHSAGAAYEALLRHFGAAGGNTVLCGEVSDPIDSLTAVCAGAEPVFIPCDENAVMLPGALELLLTKRKDIRCITVDADPGERLWAICQKHGVPLIFNAGGTFPKEITARADAAFCSHGESSAIYTGTGGLIVTDSIDIYSGAFAYHNCGRKFGAGCSLKMDDIVGGDLRVTEWTAAAAEVILEMREFSTPAPRKLVRMVEQPVFKSEYVKKQTSR